MPIKRSPRRTRAAVPPIPHPSWTFGADALAAVAGRRLTARDFWERLGD